MGSNTTEPARRTPRGSVTTAQSPSSTSPSVTTETPARPCSMRETAEPSLTSSPSARASARAPYPPAGTRFPPPSWTYAAGACLRDAIGRRRTDQRRHLNRKQRSASEISKLAVQAAIGDEPLDAVDETIAARGRQRLDRVPIGLQHARDGGGTDGRSTQPSAQTAIGAPNAPSLLVCTPAATSASVTGFPIGSWTQAPPRSTFPGPSGTVWIRPPRRSRASATTTSAPAPSAASAATRPAMPAPTTMTRMRARLSSVFFLEDASTMLDGRPERPSRVRCLGL